MLITNKPSGSVSALKHKARRLAYSFAALVMAVALTAILPVQGVVHALASNDRQQLFAAAAHEFGVPEDLLLAISYNQSRWETHKGQPSVGGGFGLMHLTTNIEAEDGRGDPARPLPARAQSEQPFTLDQAAGLLKVPANDIKQDDRQNVRGGAALLSQYARELNGGKLPTSISDWYEAVARLSGAQTTEQATDFVDSVYGSLRSGASLSTTDGQSLTLTPQNVQPTRKDLKALGLPQGAQVPETEARQTQTDCPATLHCRFVPARFAQNDPANPADYGNYDTANRPHDMKIKYIIIHDTEGSYDSAISWFQNPASYVAAHYVIRSSDGEVTQMIRTKDVGWHAGNWYVNMHSIGVEHEGEAAAGGSWYTEAMYRSSAKLVRYLADRYDIPLDRQHIIGHEQVQGINPTRVPQMHYDPGPFWDWDHYMDLVQGQNTHAFNQNNTVAAAMNQSMQNMGGRVVTIAPKFAQNRPVVTSCSGGVCTPLTNNGSNFMYVRTEPRADAPLVTDAGLHPDGTPGTTNISDWSAKAFHGEHFVAVERQGDWTALWFNGQKGWIYNPWQAPTAVSGWSRRVTPKQGKTNVAIYGRPVPEPEAFTGGTTPFAPIPLQYVMPAGQSYAAYESKAVNDYYQVLTFDRSAPGDGTVVVGNERYIPIDYNHRQAFVKASDVDLSWW
jgi:N-acetyl-anhydromuramyl-L-alanine amidase AmpD